MSALTFYQAAKKDLTPQTQGKSPISSLCLWIAYLESRCSYNSPAVVLWHLPLGGNKADSALQLLRWPEPGTWCSWLDQAPDTPDRKCRSLHKRGLNPDERQEQRLTMSGPHTQTHSHRFFASKYAKAPFLKRTEWKFCSASQLNQSRLPHSMIYFEIITQ